MGRGRNTARVDPYAKRAGETHFEHRSRVARMEADARDRSEPIVPAVARENGHYADVFTTHVESNTKALTPVSRHDPVKRWEAAERLSSGQLAAIAKMNRIWDLIGIKQKTTSAWGEALDRSYDGIEHQVISKLEAEKDLKRIEGYFPGALKDWYQIFVNVCRHGMAAGIAGGDDRNGSHTAYVTVCFVADIIASKEGL